MLKARSFLGWAVVVLLCWYALLGIVSLLLPAGRPLLVFAPVRAMQVAQAAGGTFEGGTASFTYTRSENPEFIYKLYSNGALLVLDGKTVESCRSILFQTNSQLK
jgi:hypothetical protein